MLYVYERWENMRLRRGTKKGLILIVAGKIGPCPCVLIPAQTRCASRPLVLLLIVNQQTSYPTVDSG